MRQTAKLDVMFEHYRVEAREGLPTKGMPNTVQRYRRKFEGADQKKYEPFPKGGLTICNIFRSGKVVAKGIAICSMSDNFSYKIGTKISYGRALKKLSDRLK